MKTIRNVAYTGKEIYLVTPEGPKAVWLSPGKSITVPESFISNTAKNLAKRRILTIRNA
ncbi:MAG: hypothetical protein ACXABN_17600 [Candidatus Thorarchaeota archaeon]|jgi:hypothetical protein